jgi:hypothetical protein
MSWHTAEVPWEAVNEINTIIKNFWDDLKDGDDWRYMCQHDGL